MRSPKCKISHFNQNSQCKKRQKTIKVKNFEMNQTIRYSVDVRHCKCQAHNVLLLVSASLKGLVHDLVHPLQARPFFRDNIDYFKSAHFLGSSNCTATANQHPPVHHEGWMVSGQETVIC